MGIFSRAPPPSDALLLPSSACQTLNPPLQPQARSLLPIILMHAIPHPSSHKSTPCNSSTPRQPTARTPLTGDLQEGPRSALPVAHRQHHVALPEDPVRGFQHCGLHFFRLLGPSCVGGQPLPLRHTLLSHVQADARATLQAKRPAAAARLAAGCPTGPTLTDRRRPGARLTSTMAASSPDSSPKAGLLVQTRPVMATSSGAAPRREPSAAGVGTNTN